MAEYKYSKIYKLCSNKTNKIYIGSTTKILNDRLISHKTFYESYKRGIYKYISSAAEILQYDDVNIILLEEYQCNNKQDLETRERWYIENIDNVVNKNIPVRTYEEIKEQTKNRVRQHRLKNKKIDITTSLKFKPYKFINYIIKDIETDITIIY